MCFTEGPLKAACWVKTQGHKRKKQLFRLLTLRLTTRKSHWSLPRVFKLGCLLTQQCGSSVDGNSMWQQMMGVSADEQTFTGNLTVWLEINLDPSVSVCLCLCVHMCLKRHLLSAYSGEAVLICSPLLSHIINWDCGALYFGRHTVWST